MYTAADFLIRVKNAYMASRDKVTTPYSKLNYSIAKILEKEGLISKAEILTDKKSPIRKIEISLLDSSISRVFTEVKVISKPSAHNFLSAQKVKGFREPGVVIMTTSKGVMTRNDAIKNKIGGEILFRIY